MPAWQKVGWVDILNNPHPDLGPEGQAMLRRLYDRGWTLNRDPKKGALEAWDPREADLVRFINYGAIGEFAAAIMPTSEDFLALVRGFLAALADGWRTDLSGDRLHLWKPAETTASFDGYAGLAMWLEARGYTKLP